MGRPGLPHSHGNSNGLWRGHVTFASVRMSDAVQVQLSSSVTAGIRERRSKVSIRFGPHEGRASPLLELQPQPKTLLSPATRVALRVRQASTPPPPAPWGMVPAHPQPPSSLSHGSRSSLGAFAPALPVPWDILLTALVPSHPSGSAWEVCGGEGFHYDDPRWRSVAMQWAKGNCLRLRSPQERRPCRGPGEGG